jgi:L,D-peptidoglycan transpeptidase YkuD (ErfK/YbiS/YcfS/YnhG family)
VVVLLALLAASPVPAESRQLVLSVSRSWDAAEAEVRRYERSGPDRPWSPVGPPVTAALGRGGLGWGRGLHGAGLAGEAKREGDGRSPAGVFELRRATGYSRLPPPGTRLEYRQATPSLRCVDDPRSRSYNRLVDEATVEKDWASAEEMRRPDEQYRLVVWVGHNDAPPEAGAGSCIFLHIRREAPSTTVGCTAFESADMEELLRWLDPLGRPVLVQLPAAVRDELGAPWGLP